MTTKKAAIPAPHRKLEIWERREKTNPDDTKPVEYGRKFTAIDAYSQIRCATEEFGPVGKGWGWKSALSYPPNDTVVAAVELWWLDEDDVIHEIGPVYGAKSLFTGKGDKRRPDEDAPKKAVTDGITKSLSYLGFNADVFLGKFDDNKYVNERRQEENALAKSLFSSPARPRSAAAGAAVTKVSDAERQAANDWANEFLIVLGQTPNTTAEIKLIWHRAKGDYGHCRKHNPDIAKTVKDAVMEKVQIAKAA